MKYVIDNDLHIHSKISLCSNDPQQTNERILNYAISNGLKTICLTDHFWDEKVKCADLIDFYVKQNYEHVKAGKPLPQTDGVKFLFGCETELTKNLILGISPERYDYFDFIIIPTTHFHMKGFTIDNNITSPEDKAKCWLERLNAVLEMDLPFNKIGLAHLTCCLIDKDRKKYLQTLENIPENDALEVFKKAANKEVGIELNGSDMRFADTEADIVLRLYRLAKNVGCKFYCGSDAHHPREFEGAKKIFERAVDYLNLTEDDKFVVHAI